MEIVYRKLSELKPNPKNPRKSTKEAIEKLARSISENPKFFEARPILLSDRTGALVIIGGERRSEAAYLLKMETVPTILMSGLTEAQEDEILIKDNTHAGDWDAKKLTKWSDTLLKELDSETKSKITNARKAWEKGRLEKCDLRKITQFHELKDLCFVSIFRKSENGKLFTEIKSEEFVELFAEECYKIVSKTIGGDSWAIVAPPRRRHKDFNFSIAIIKKISIFAKKKIIFYDDCFECATRQRINPDFSLVKNIREKNVVLFDDIFTTGSTIKACHKLLVEAGKNVFCIIGIYNGFSNG